MLNLADKLHWFCLKLLVDIKLEIEEVVRLFVSIFFGIRWLCYVYDPKAIDIWAAYLWYEVIQNVCFS